MWTKELNNVADVLIFSILETAQRYKDLASTVLWMPQYFDHIFCSKNGKLPERLNPDKPIYDLCFIGSCDPLRKRWLDYLQNRYNCFFARNGIQCKKEIRGWGMAEVYAQSKIAINIQRELFLNPGAFVTSNRTYNAMGSGAFFINHRVKQLELVFDIGIDCAMHTDTLQDLCDKIDYYLEHEEKRELIAKNGQNKVLYYHTLEQRIKEYWEVMQLVHENKDMSNYNGAYGNWVV